MKNLLILYNIIFFFAGNVLLSNIHYFNHHHDPHDYHDLLKEDECYECINFEDSKNYILDLKEVKFSDTIKSFVFEYSDTIDSLLHKNYKSRSPPIS